MICSIRGMLLEVNAGTVLAGEVVTHTALMFSLPIAVGKTLVNQLLCEQRIYLTTFSLHPAHRSLHQV